MSSISLDILTAIRNGTAYSGKVLSRSDAILKSIANGTAYTDAPLSRFEEQLLAIKNGETISGTPASRIDEILFAIANGTLNEYLAGKNIIDIHNVSNARAQWVNIEIKDSEIFAETQSGEVVNRYEIDFNCLKNTDYNCSLKVTLNEVVQNNSWIIINAGEAVTRFQLKQVLETQDVSFSFNSGDNTTLSLWLYLQSEKTGKEYQSAIYRDIKIEAGTTATLYTPYAFTSDLEEALISTADKLKG